ncbi:hypothetical protein HDU98_004336, partial [Podochytrium sp. JEL0797]
MANFTDTSCHPLLRKPTTHFELPFGFELDMDSDHSTTPKPHPTHESPQLGHHIYAASMPEASLQSGFFALQQRQAMDASSRYLVDPSTFEPPPLSPSHFFAPSNQSHSTDDWAQLLGQLSSSQPMHQSYFPHQRAASVIPPSSDFGSPSTMFTATPPYLPRPPTPRSRIIVHVNSPVLDAQSSPLPKGKYLDNGILVNTNQADTRSRQAHSGHYSTTTNSARMRSHGTDDNFDSHVMRPGTP